MEKKNLGQFFTPEFLADFMIGLSTISKSSKILEPACGEGIFLKLLNNRGFRNTIGYEIDSKIKPIIKSKIIYKSFVSAFVQEKFDLVIGNPPYIRWKNLDNSMKEELLENELWKKYFNSLCDYLCIFILKSIQLLKNEGELIFITPEYWINTKHAETLRNYLIHAGYFTDIIHFNETPIFDNVASSILIFRFVKSLRLDRKENIRIVKFHSSQRLSNEMLIKVKNGFESNNIKIFERKQFELNERWILAPIEKCSKLKSYENKCIVKDPMSIFGLKKEYSTLGDIADIGNGLVSGLDRAFQIPENTKLSKLEKESTLPVLKAKNMSAFFHGEISHYIFLNGNVKCEDDLINKYPNFYEILNPFKIELSKRYNYSKEINYWEWVFLRSFKLFKREQEKIFIPCKERISHKNYFRFCYVKSGIFPTQDVTAVYLKPSVKENIYYILALLNTDKVFEWLKYNGVVKGNIVEFSEKPLSSIPVRLIDWESKRDIVIHDKVVLNCKKYILTKNKNDLKKLQETVNSLF